MSNDATNRERVLQCVRNHPDGIDDDQISETAEVKPRQQVYQIANRLADEGLIRRISVVKPGKRRKIHNFPADQATLPDEQLPSGKKQDLPSWKKRLAVLVAATGDKESEILDKALESYARDLLQRGFE